MVADKYVSVFLGSNMAKLKRIAEKVQLEPGRVVRLLLASVLKLPGGTSSTVKRIKKEIQEEENSDDTNS